MFKFKSKMTNSIIQFLKHGTEIYQNQPITQSLHPQNPRTQSRPLHDHPRTQRKHLAQVWLRTQLRQASPQIQNWRNCHQYGRRNEES